MPCLLRPRVVRLLHAHPRFTGHEDNLGALDSGRVPGVAGSGDSSGPHRWRTFYALARFPSPCRLLNFVHLLMGSYVDARNLGKLYREVVAVRLSARNVFLPDLAFFTQDQVRGSVRRLHQKRPR